MKFNFSTYTSIARVQTVHSGRAAVSNWQVQGKQMLAGNGEGRQIGRIMEAWGAGVKKREA
jgi:hypothetical protein